MSEFHASHVQEGPFGTPDPLRALVEYYEANGYELISSEEGPLGSLTWKVPDTSHETPTTESEASDDPADEAPTEGADLPVDAAEVPASETQTLLEPSPEPADAGDVTPTADGPLEDLPESSGADDLPDTIWTRVHLRRGKAGASWWTSNMAELLSDVEIKVIGDTVRIAYTVETTLQHFTDDDHAFWAHEAKQALRVARGQGRAVDWRDNENIRVERQQKDILMVGVQLAFLAAVFVAIAYFAFSGR